MDKPIQLFPFWKQLPKKDVKEEFPNVGGSLAKNLRYCRACYQFYCDVEIWQQAVAKLVKEYGNSFSVKNLRRMMQFNEQFPDCRITDATIELVSL